MLQIICCGFFPSSILREVHAVSRSPAKYRFIFIPQSISFAKKEAFSPLFPNEIVIPEAFFPLPHPPPVLILSSFFEVPWKEESGADEASSSRKEERGRLTGLNARPEKGKRKPLKTSSISITRPDSCFPYLVP